MSPRRQPRSLFKKCVDHLSVLMNNLAREQSAVTLFSNLSLSLYHIKSILPDALQAAIGDAIFRWNELNLEALSPAQVKILLELGVYRLDIVGSVVESGILENHNASNLRYLSLSYGGSGDRTAKLFTFLHSSVNLTELRCRDFCNDSMIEIIASTCRNLRTLQLRACDVTDQGVLKLCGLNQLDLRNCIEILYQGGTLVPSSVCSRSLKELKLEMTQVTEAGVAVIMLVLTNIELLRVPDIKMEQVFNFLHKMKNLNVQNDLKEFHSRENLNEFQLNILTTLCPNLDYIQLSLVGNLDIDLLRLKELTKLRKLRRAKLADAHSDAILWLMEQMGNQMIHLYIHITHQTKMSQEKISITRRHLKCLAMLCPNLESLVLDGYTLSDDYIPQSQYPTYPNDPQYFHKLTTLNLFSMNLSEEDLKMFLRKCRNMKVLELVLQNPHVLNDRLINEILDDGVWKNLMKVRISHSPLTCKVMHRLVMECPNLQVLEGLYTWLVPKIQLNEFKEKVRRENLDVNVC